MHKLRINRLGPIDYIEMECRDFMVFTGAQASGKSTIAKAIFLFRTVKDDILSLMIKKSVDFAGSKKDSLHKAMEAEVREKFLRVFGSSWCMENDMYIEYRYNESTYIKISLREETIYPTPNYLWVDYSENIKAFLLQKNDLLSSFFPSMPDEEKAKAKMELNQLFSDNSDTVFVPAGRSMITLLATQLNYFYSTMEDAQKKAIDFCTRNYLERVLRIRPEFENGLQGLINNNPMKAVEQKENLRLAEELITTILKGSYRYNNGDERLELSDNHYVKINFTSSGQQEAVWILNLLYYYLLQNKKTYFIIEEPESHLFPDAQKCIAELIALMNHANHEIFVTTHSPYVLGSLNNLLYAGQFCKTDKKAATIINPKYWIKPSDFDAWFVQGGRMINGMDDEIHLIKNEMIDQISETINGDFDRLFALRMKNEGMDE